MLHSCPLFVLYLLALCYRHDHLRKLREKVEGDQEDQCIGAPVPKKSLLFSVVVPPLSSVALNLIILQIVQFISWETKNIVAKPINLWPKCSIAKGVDRHNMAMMLDATNYYL